MKRCLSKWGMAFAVCGVVFVGASLAAAGNTRSKQDVISASTLYSSGNHVFSIADPRWTRKFVHDAYPVATSIAPDNSVLCFTLIGHGGTDAYAILPISTGRADILGQILDQPQSDLRHPYFVQEIRRSIVAESGGVCAFVNPQGQLVRVRGADRQTISIAGREGSFLWVGLSYSRQRRASVLLGATRFAIHADEDAGASAHPVRAYGETRGIRFSNFRCCGLLAPDGKALYAVFDGGDENSMGFTALGRFNTRTGLLEKAYLPYFYKGAKNFPDAVFNSDNKTKVELNEESANEGFALSPDGKTLYINAWYKSGNRETLIAINTQTGNIQALPIQVGMSFRLIDRGKKLLVLKRNARWSPSGDWGATVTVFDLASNTFGAQLQSAEKLDAATPP